MNTIEKIIVTVHLNSLYHFQVCSTMYILYLVHTIFVQLYVQFEIETHLILFKQLVNKNNINL